MCIDSPENQNHKHLFEQQKQIHTKMLNSAHMDHNSKRFTDTSNFQKEVWNIVKENTNYKSSNSQNNINEITNPDGTTSKIPKEIANVLYNNFIETPSNFHEN